MKISDLKYDGRGLIPAVVQEADTGEVPDGGLDERGLP
jgi:hypothetical protein